MFGLMWYETIVRKKKNNRSFPVYFHVTYNVEKLKYKVNLNFSFSFSFSLLIVDKNLIKCRCLIYIYICMYRVFFVVFLSGKLKNKKQKKTKTILQL